MAKNKRAAKSPAANQPQNLSEDMGVEILRSLEMILTLLTIRDLELSRSLFYLSLDPKKHQKKLDKERKRLKKQIIRNTQELSRLEQETEELFNGFTGKNPEAKEKVKKKKVKNKEKAKKEKKKK